MREASWESLVLVTKAGLQMEKCAEGLGWSVLTVQWERWAREPITPKKQSQKCHPGRHPLRLCQPWCSSCIRMSLAKSPPFSPRLLTGALLQGHGGGEGLNWALGLCTLPVLQVAIPLGSQVWEPVGADRHLHTADGIKMGQKVPMEEFLTWEFFF